LILSRRGRAAPLPRPTATRFLPLRLLLIMLIMLLAQTTLAACTRPSPRVAKPAGATLPERVLVVVNRRSPDSEAVGRYYMRRRGVPEAHLVRVDVPVEEEIGELTFSSDLLAPVRDAIDSLPGRIDFILLTTGVPLRIGGRRGYSVDAHVAGMRLSFPPMVGFDSTWMTRYRNPYYGARVPFNSDQFGMYLVTRLDCTLLLDCMALVDRSMAARPVRGPFFLDARPLGQDASADDGYTMTNRMLYMAAARLSNGGAEVLLDSGPRFVAPPRPVMGYASWGSNDVAFDAAAYRALRFLPGAIAETFVSTSARTFRSTSEGQSRIADLVAQGVTGVKGYVSEPYTIALADPSILFERYLSGFTLAESFYAASRMVLWKDVVIGDPLCAPYALPASIGPRVY
jgi:uncharacterized protein (TIGR03790 family)